MSAVSTDCDAAPGSNQHNFGVVIIQESGPRSSDDHARLKCSSKRNEPISATNIQDDHAANAEHGPKKGKIQINSAL